MARFGDTHLLALWGWAQLFEASVQLIRIDDVYGHVPRDQKYVRIEKGGVVDGDGGRAGRVRKIEIDGKDA